MSFGSWRWGGWHLWGVDEVILTPPHLPSKPLSGDASAASYRFFQKGPTYLGETAALRAATANVQAPPFDLGPRDEGSIRNKCRTLNYPADGVGIKGALKPHESFCTLSSLFLFFF